MTMYISDSYRTSGGGGGGTGGGGGFSGNSYDLGNDFTIHALRRDEDGMLRYTKIRSIDDEVIDFHRLDGTPYLDIATGLYDYVEETTEDKSYVNDPQDKYQQYRFDSRKITYFIDDDGYFVIRFNEAYDYTTEGPK
jgi:hypothetical protein|tara:strand:+ start:244 stop:654 length:411 start_codon:yes stop_codon:yes gene_type:complete